MIKVLAAEMSDPQRLRRGKQYAKDGSVLDIEIGTGVVTAEVQGSRPTPYVATVHVTPGDGMPLRRDITTGCTCPDDDNGEGHACKHVLAAMFSLSDELLLEPELLDRWRGRAAAGGDTAGPDAVESTPDDPTLRRGHLRLVRSDELDPSPTAPRRDPLAPLLAAPTGAVLPEIPALERVELDPPRSPDLARTLRDAVARMHLDWD
jgi:uncharacterized Zn finger protein